MDYLRDLSNFIDDLPDHDPLDPVILQLPKLEWQMTTLLRKLRDQMDLFKAAQREYRIRSIRHAPVAAATSAQAMTHSKANNLDVNWTAARQRKIRTEPQTSDRPKLPTATALQLLMAPSTSREPHDIEVPVSPNMALRCIEIPDMNAIRKDGILYYIPRIRRFAIRMAGFVIHGNIGTVYVSEPSPQKIHDCDAYPSCNMTMCRYYHNPLACPGSTDIRNFAATSWLYHPGAHTSGTKKTRKLASRLSLDEDILTVTSVDLAYYNEQLMHDILCSIIMNYFVRKDS